MAPIPQSSSTPYDLVIIGAGWFGLSAARTYHQLHPTHSLLILESASSCGGTWSSDRLYPGLKSNNIHGRYDHPDFPMDEATYGVKSGEHIPGTVLHHYLTDFAQHFGIYERIRFESMVESVEPGSADGWKVRTKGVGKKEVDGSKVIETKKLIIATGLTSTPNLPKYKGQETFTEPFFHARDFCKNGSLVETAEKVVIVGGAKSAFDIAYAFAMSPKSPSVDIIIRETGQGPVWLLPRGVTPLKRPAEELLTTRFITWFSPCPFSSSSGFSLIPNFLHSTAIGRLIVSGFWSVLSNDAISLNNYNNPLLKIVKPWTSAFWSGSKISINNYDTSFFSLIESGRIRVHITDISSLSGNTVHLASGESLKTDALICSTGWKSNTTFPITVPGTHGLGLPYTAEEKAALDTKYDTEILSLFPSLAHPPVPKTSLTPSTKALPGSDEQGLNPTADPLRLYRFIVPPTLLDSKTLAFAGMVSTIATSTFAAVQSLWICAFFDGKLDTLPSTQEEITREVMMHTQWGKWRYPWGYGARIPDMAADSLFYSDMLLRDLGLTVQRKGGLREIFETYKPRDYKGLVEEWIEKKEA